MTSHRTGRRAIALPSALAAVALLGALATAGVVAARAELRAAHGAAAAVAARTAADAALADGLAHWPPNRNVTLAVGETDSTAAAARGATLHALRLGPRTFLLDARAAATARLPGAERLAARRLWLFVRLRRVTARTGGAVTVAGRLDVDSGAAVSGADTPPPGWTGCGTWADAPGPTAAIAAAHADAVRVHPAARLGGAVRALADAAAPATYDRFGEAPWTSLADHAAVVAPPEAAPSPRADRDGCVVDGASWGEPRRGAGSIGACQASSPVVRARAPSLALRGPARGQGLLLVEGDLHVAGDVEWAGLVVVRGTLRADALRVRGALMIADDDGRGASVLGPGSEVTYSSCAVARALIAAARPTPLGRRSWAEVTR